MLDEIGQLHEERHEAIQYNQSMNLQSVFQVQSKASEWNKVIKEVLNLSETIEIVIFDLWIRNKENDCQTEVGYRAFGQDFVENYNRGERQVDIATIF